MNAVIRVLLVEDNPTDRLLAEDSLSDSHFLIEHCQRLGEALNLLARNPYDVILLDLGLPDSQGLDTLRTLRGSRPQVPVVVVLTGKDDEEFAMQALKEGAMNYLVKSELQGGLLKRAVRYAVERDISDKRHRRSEERYRTLIEVTTSIVWSIPASGVFEAEQPGWAAFTGQTFEQYSGWGWLKAIHPKDQELTARLWNAAVAERSLYQIEQRVRRADGEFRLMSVRAVPILDYGGAIREWVGVHTDITDRKQAEETLRLQDWAIESLVEGVTITDPNLPDNPIIYANKSFLRMTGYKSEEVIGRNCRFLQGPKTDPETVARMRTAIQAGLPCSVELVNYLKNGTPFWNGLSISPILDTAGHVTHFVGVQSDVSPMKLMEQQFHQSQKMEAVGQLAGGVAHDFNNLLTIISGYSELLLAMLPSNDPKQEAVKAIGEAGERAAALTRQLLSFSRKAVLETKVVDINDVVKDAMKLLRRMIGEDILLTTVLDPNIRRIKVDADQVGQVLMNLAINARDAMPLGGKLNIETSDVQLDGDQRECQPGHYIRLAVSDNGCGMTPEVQAHIFEPFFTTKEQGKGTGLGLATVYGIVRQSGGTIELDSELGHGTTFRIYLPAYDEPHQTSGGGRIAARALAGTETVLLVEDEDAVRAIALLALQTQGYNVLHAENGKMALRMVEKHRGPIDLLVTDVIMPGMSGRELADTLCQQFPRLKLLYLSGYTDDSVIRNGILQHEVAYMQKPYTPLSLARRVRDVLDE